MLVLSPNGLPQWSCRQSPSVSHSLTPRTSAAAARSKVIGTTSIALLAAGVLVRAFRRPSTKATSRTCRRLTSRSKYPTACKTVPRPSSAGGALSVPDNELNGPFPAETNFAVEVTVPQLPAESEDDVQTVSGRPAASFLEYVGILGLMVFDVAWLSESRSIALGALSAGINVQAAILLLNGFSVKNYQIELQLSLVLWTLGNAFWWSSELPKQDFLPFDPMTAALVTSVASVAFLLLAYVTTWSSIRSEGGATDEEHAGRRLRVLGIVLSPGLSKDLYILPWIISDLCWMWSDIDGAATSPWRPLVVLTLLVTGAAAIGLAGNSVSRLARKRGSDRKSSVLLQLGEFYWVLGDIIWAAEESLTGTSSDTGILCSICFIMLGMCLVLYSAFSKDIPLSETKKSSFPDVISM